MATVDLVYDGFLQDPSRRYRNDWAGYLLAVWCVATVRSNHG